MCEKTQVHVVNLHLMNTIIPNNSINTYSNICTHNFINATYNSTQLNREQVVYACKAFWHNTIPYTVYNI